MIIQNSRREYSGTAALMNIKSRRILILNQVSDGGIATWTQCADGNEAADIYIAQRRGTLRIRYKFGYILVQNGQAQERSRSYILGSLGVRDGAHGMLHSPHYRAETHPIGEAGTDRRIVDDDRGQ